MGWRFLKVPNPYLGDYRLLMAVPLVLILIAAFFIPRVQTGVDLKGGLLLSIQTQANADPVAIKNAVSKYSGNVEVRTVTTPSGSTGVEVELENDPALDKAEGGLQALGKVDSDLADAEVKLSAATQQGGDATFAKQRVDALTASALEQSSAIMTEVGSAKTVPAGKPHEAVRLANDEYANAKQRLRENIISSVRAVAPFESYSYREVGSSLSRFFLAKTEQVVLYAFVLAAIVIFLVFRSIAPAVAVLFGAIADISITMGAMGIFGIPLTLASIATLLMLIGFSLDTDVMLTIRVTKRKEGTAAERAYEAMKTGFLMNFTTIGAFGALYAISQWLQIPTYAQIGAVAVIGGFADFFATWAFNAPLILWYAHRQEKKRAAAA